MKITKRQLRRIIVEAIDPRELEEPLGGWAGNALTNDPDYYHPDDTDNQPRAVGDLVRSVDFRGDARGGDFKRAVGDEIGTVIEIDDSEDGPVQYLVHWPNGTPTMGSADEFEVVNENKITRRQLRRIIRESYYDEDGNYRNTNGELAPDPSLTGLEPERFRSKDEAEDAAVGMVFGDDPSQRLSGDLPFEIRIVSIDGEYALYAMTDYADRYNGEGKVIAAVPRGGSIRYGRQIG